MTRRRIAVGAISGAAHRDGFRSARGARGLSPLTAAATLLVVTGLVGAGAFVTFERIGPSSAKVSSCSPPGSLGCAQLAGVHDLSVLAPFATAETGQSVPFTVLLPAGSSASSFGFSFGDGTPTVNSSTATEAHAFTAPGTYLIQANATIDGSPHDNLHDLAVITVESSAGGAVFSDAPLLAGQIISNSTSTSAPSAVLRAGDSLTVSGSYLDAPTNPDFLAQAPTVVASAGASSPAVTAGTNRSVDATVRFPTSGTFEVTMVGTATGLGADAGQTATADYVWTVVVTPSGVAGGLAGAAATQDPHPGTIIYYS
ncbi:MAG: PKD domain-containing protein, partial [Thermoplasmata archaeon]